MVKHGLGSHLRVELEVWPWLLQARGEDRLLAKMRLLEPQPWRPFFGPGQRPGCVCCLKVPQVLLRGPGTPASDSRCSPEASSFSLPGTGRCRFSGPAPRPVTLGGGQHSVSEALQGFCSTFMVHTDPLEVLPKHSSDSWVQGRA